MEIYLDGSNGEGGGQILRTALALSMITGKAFRMDNIRSKRAKPGLMRQHLVCVQAAADICGASVTGAELRSTELTFAPGPVKPGDYCFKIGSAGSTALVFQTVFLPLALASAASTVIIEGGTHNPMAPPFEFLAEVFLPAAYAMGLQATLKIETYGFYPVGGGRVHATIGPAEASEPFVRLERGELTEMTASVLLSEVPARVAEREFNVLWKRFPQLARNWHVPTIVSPGPGNVALLALKFAEANELFASIGDRGVSAEAVANRLADEASAYLATGAPVGEHLADQLLMPMALRKGGSFRTGKPSLHLETQVQTMAKFLAAKVQVTEAEDATYRVDVTPG
jgi:RNA 3'-terminal phosphate cyclase (ATP)